MSSTQAYGEEWYWDKRYEQESGTFDWYQKYPSLSPLLHLYIPQPTTASLLVVGCGTSGIHTLLISIRIYYTPSVLKYMSTLILRAESQSEHIFLNKRSNVYKYYFNKSLLLLLLLFAAFSEGMVDDGYDNVVNIDISSVAIQTMRQRYSNRPQLKCILLSF